MNKNYKRCNYNDAPPAMLSEARKKVHIFINGDYSSTVVDVSFCKILGSIRSGLDPLFNLSCEIEPISGAMYFRVKMLFPPLIEHLI